MFLEGLFGCETPRLGMQNPGTNPGPLPETAGASKHGNVPGPEDLGLLGLGPCFNCLEETEPGGSRWGLFRALEPQVHQALKP